MNKPPLWQTDPAPVSEADQSLAEKFSQLDQFMTEIAEKLSTNYYENSRNTK
jgi:hypothetical protein